MILNNIFTWTYFGRDAMAKRQYQNDEQAMADISRFFAEIDDTGFVLLLLLISILIPALICWIYHGVFNKKPNRHYRPVYQLLFFLIALVATFIVALVVESLLVEPPRVDSNLRVFLLDAALGAMVWGALVYVVVALFIGLTGRTNAFPLHKIFSKR